VEARPVGVDGGEEVLDVPNFGQWASFWHLPLQFALTHFLVHLFSLFVSACWPGEPDAIPAVAGQIWCELSIYRFHDRYKRLQKDLKGSGVEHAEQI
jgi:hypothetical protein